MSALEEAALQRKAKLKALKEKAQAKEVSIRLDSYATGSDYRTYIYPLDSVHF